MSALVSVSSSTVDTLLWHAGLVAVVVFAVCRVVRCVVDRGDVALSRRLLRSRERDCDAAFDQGYDQGYEAGRHSGGLEDIAEGVRERVPVPTFPDLDEDQHPADPSGAHAEATGRVSVDDVTGYVRLRDRLSMSGRAGDSA